jgi:hypothetical protein
MDIESGGHMPRRIAILLGAITLGALAPGCNGEEGFTPPDRPSIAGNWQFSMASTVAGTSAVIAGSISQSDGSLTGAVHVKGSSCIDTLITIGLSGTLTADSSLSLTSAAAEGQVISVTARASNDALTGTYAIHGGCGDGDHGQATGTRVPRLDGDWIIRLVRSSGGLDDYVSERWVGQTTLAQGSASADGSFGVSGTIVNACSNCSFLAGTIRAGTFPSPSFVLGTSVVLEIETPNGTVIFHGTVDESGSRIVGGHQFVGGIHDGKSGSACFARLAQTHGIC